VRARFHVAGTTLSILLCLAQPGHAQTLTLPPPLAENVEALPRMTGQTEVANKVNSVLETLDLHQLKYLACYWENPDNYQENLKYAFQSVDVLSEGPTFLSILVTVGRQCGDEAERYIYKETLNFDLASGDKLYLDAALPEGWAANGRSARNVSTKEMFAIYLEGLAEAPPPDECSDVLADFYNLGWSSVILGVDSKAKSLILIPEMFPFQVDGCKLTVLIGVNKLKALGFDSWLIKRLEATP
jgi:hypothetical protein